MYSNSEILSLFSASPSCSPFFSLSKVVIMFCTILNVWYFFSRLFCFRKMFLNNGWTGNISQHDFCSKLLTACFFFSPSSFMLLFLRGFFLCWFLFFFSVRLKLSWDCRADGDGKRDDFKQRYERKVLRRFTSNRDVFPRLARKRRGMFSRSTN